LRSNVFKLVAAMDTQVAISIGVRQAGSLVELPGAINGAREFRAWAKRQNYKTFLVTDEKKAVTIARLSKLIKRVVDEIQPERLLLYYAGHGIQPSVNTAYWLLSNWEADGNEAVNVNLSSYHAKRSSIRQIALFADACRSTVRGAATVGGASIFPKATVSARRQPQWDHFLASRVEEVAQEVPGKDAGGAYGVFTRCLMTALSGRAEEALENRPGMNPAQVVSSQKLADYLEEAVPLESGKIPGADVQFPEVAPGWRPERNYYLGLKTSRRYRQGGPPFGAGRNEPRDEGPGAPALADRAKVAVAVAQRELEARTSEMEFASTIGRETFETRQGLTIIGETPRRFITFGRRRKGDLFQEGGAWHIRGDGENPSSVLIELKSGTWIATCMLPEFVGTILIKEGLAASLNFLPARDGRYRQESFRRVAPTVNRLTALMHQGRYGDPAVLTKAAESIRRYKHSNPSLGILAAYAYERAGVIDEIDDMAVWFAREEQPVPYDVAMLSTMKIDPGNPGRLLFSKSSFFGRKTVAVGGSFPLMTQGWSFLDPADETIHRELFRIRAGLLPSLWTTLKPKAGRRLAKLLEDGSLQ
jgi:hypothetical protein